MLVTGFQLENLSKDKLVDRLLQVENIADKIECLNKRYNNAFDKYFIQSYKFQKIEVTFFIIE